MHIVAQPYKCVNCGHEFRYSPHEHHPAPVTSDGIPTCPVCWDRYLKSIGLGYCTVNWHGDGSEHEKASGQ